METLSVSVDESTTAFFKEYISTLQDKIDVANLKADSLQHAVSVCKDTVSHLHNVITESTNYWTILTSPYGVAIIAIVVVAIVLVAWKKGFTISKGNTTLSIGGTQAKKETEK